MKRGISVVLILVVMALAFFGFIFYLGYGQKIIRLPYAEINEYNGTRLDSINDFRENSIKGVQYIDIEDYVLKIDGLVENSRDYTYSEVLSHQAYEKIVRLNCVEGWSVDILWKGILINDLFNEIKPLSNASIIIFRAYDGYSVTYPVDYFSNKNILIAYEMNNVTIPPERGFPFVLVAEDKWGYKWIKWITEIEFSDDINYSGYWESRGYSKEGNLNESFIG